MLNVIVSNQGAEYEVKAKESAVKNADGYEGLEKSMDPREESINNSDDFAKLPSIESLEGISPEDTCDEDNRNKVEDTTLYPWTAVCKLIITRDDGTRGVASGWLNGKGSVITAGHCVYSRDLNKWNKSIIVIPGMNHLKEPFGRYTSTNLHSVKGWTERGDENYDYGAILLDVKVGDRTGYFGFRSANDSDIQNLTITNSGYPADKTGDDSSTQWWMSGNIERLTDRKVYYKLDTYGGNSGSPVYIDDYRAIAIHAYGGCAGGGTNSGTRVNNEVFDNLMFWRQEGERS